AESRFTIRSLRRDFGGSQRDVSQKTTSRGEKRTGAANGCGPAFHAEPRLKRSKGFYRGTRIFPDLRLIGLNDRSGTTFPLGSVTCKPNRLSAEASPLPMTVAWKL